MSKKRRPGKSGKAAKKSAPAKAQQTAEPVRGDERLVAALQEEPGRTEIWVRLAELTFIGLVVLVFYLGLRPGGVGPVLAFQGGQVGLGIAALLLLITGAVQSFRRPPLRRKGRIRALIALVLVIGIGSTPFPYPSSREFEPSAVRFELPVEGAWRVYWGGSRREDNRYSGWFADRRWGMALVKEADRRTHSGTGAELSDYYAYGEAVLAPAAGRVVSAVDGEPDRPPGARGSADEPFGNQLVILVAEGEYLFLAHLLAGSLEVEVGDVVVPGQVLARVGHSGLSTVVAEPHLALHLQTTPDAGRGEAIPWKFHDYEANGRPVEAGLPRGGVATDGRLTGEEVRRAGP